MNIGKLFMYIFIVFVLGLTQSWVVVAILWLQEFDIEFISLLKDGTYFFFSTSLVYTSVFTLIEKKKLTNWDKVVTCLALFIVTGLSITGYSIELASSLQENRGVVFEGRFITAQVVCLGVSAIYSIYAGQRAGIFNRVNYAHF
jgi:hypothetical protein